MQHKDRKFTRPNSKTTASSKTSDSRKAYGNARPSAARSYGAKSDDEPVKVSRGVFHREDYRGGKGAHSKKYISKGYVSKEPVEKDDGEDQGTEDRLQKIIASTGLCSRRAAETMILEGRVTLNGKRVTKLGVKADPFVDDIKVDHKKIHVPYKRKHIYFVLNKPSGYITSLSDPFDRPIVMDLLPKDLRRLIPVGRLDYNTEGILLFTDDGELVHRLTHPKFGVRRRYLVRTKGLIPQEKLDKVAASGIFVDGVKLKDIIIDDVRYSGSATWFQIEIGEGRNREVRKIVLALGAEVSRLKRIAYGPIYNRIPPKGAARPLTAEEVYELYTMVGLEKPGTK